MNKRIRNKKVRDALIRAAIRLLFVGLCTELQAKQETRSMSSAVYRRRFRAAIRCMSKFPAVSTLDITRDYMAALYAAVKKNKINPGVNEHESI